MRKSFNQQQREGIQKIEEIYKTIPSLECIPGCHACCGPIMMSELEAARLPARVSPATGNDCRFLGKHGCTIYAIRPAVCRLMGTVPDLACPRGCKPVTGHMTAEHGHMILTCILRISGDQGVHRG